MFSDAATVAGAPENGMRREPFRSAHPAILSGMQRRVLSTLTLAALALTAPETVAATNINPAAKRAAAPTATDRWRVQAVAAIEKWETLDSQSASTSVLNLSFVARAIAEASGWDDPRLPGLLTRLMALRNPDGGWGVNRPFDAFSDGSANPASTSYTVTMTDHIGPFLLGAWQHGLLADAEPLTSIGALLMRLPRWRVAGGHCVAYSTSRDDQRDARQCVHNVNASLGLFLGQLADAGVPVSGASNLRMFITRAEVASYDVTAKNWPYALNGRLNDAVHAAMSTEAMLRMAPDLAARPLVNLMTRQGVLERDAIAHFRLGAFRCDMAYQWLPEMQDFVAAPPSPAQHNLAQAAFGAARLAQRCGDS